MIRSYIFLSITVLIGGSLQSSTGIMSGALYWAVVQQEVEWMKELTKLKQEIAQATTIPAWADGIKKMRELSRNDEFRSYASRLRTLDDLFIAAHIIQAAEPGLNQKTWLPIDKVVAKGIVNHNISKVPLDFVPHHFHADIARGFQWADQYKKKMAAFYDTMKTYQSINALPGNLRQTFVNLDPLLPFIIPQHHYAFIIEGLEGLDALPALQQQANKPDSSPDFYIRSLPQIQAVTDYINGSLYRDKFAPELKAEVDTMREKFLSESMGLTAAQKKLADLMSKHQSV